MKVSMLNLRDFSPAPKYYDKILKVYYGENHIQLRNLPLTHGTDIIFDAEKSYIDVLKGE